MSTAVRQTVPHLPDPPRAATFDEIHFERQTFGDPGLQEEIIQLFLAQLEEARKAFAAPMTSTAWRFLTHTLKGAAASVGALRIAELAARWELSGTPLDGAARGMVLAQFEAEAGAFAAAVRRLHN